MGFLDKVHDDLSTRLLIGHPFTDFVSVFPKWATFCNIFPAVFIKILEIIWDKVFKNGPSNFCVSRPYSFKFFKGCLPKILLGPFLNTLSHLIVCV